MYNIEFYEDLDGNSDLRDFLHLLYENCKTGFYKLAAFLDYLAENGTAGDKAIGKIPVGTLYMHCITDAGEQENLLTADGRRTRTGRHTEKYWVILYGQLLDGTFVMLHHYTTGRVPAGVPLQEMYRAARELQLHNHIR